MQSFHSRQLGVSLLYALIMLLVISMVGVSAVRMSGQDMLVASNEQQQMLVDQATESAQRELVNYYQLNHWAKAGKSAPATKQQALKDEMITTRASISTGIQYSCLGKLGAANSMGVGTSKCRAYHFTLDSRLSGTAAVSKRFRSVGKQRPPGL